MVEVARHARLSTDWDEVARWTGELVAEGYVLHGPKSDTRPLPPPGVSWMSHDLSRVADYRLTGNGRQEAQRTREHARRERTDTALGLRYPQLARPWMSDAQARAIAEPLDRLRDALDAGRPVPAIGAAKDLVEAACKVAMHHGGKEPASGESLTSLFKAAAAVLPDTGHDEQLGRRLASVVHQLGELRNATGAGHGQATLTDVPAGDARLAAAAAVALADFVLGE